MNSNPHNTPPFWGRQGPIKYPVLIDSKGVLPPKARPRKLTDPLGPARRNRPKRRSVTGYVPFKSLGVVVWYESSLERDMLRLLKEASPLVGVLEQPLSLDRKALGFGRGKYTPDFLVWRMGTGGEPLNVTLVEVKPEAVLRAKWKEIRPKLLAAQRFARRQGWRFLLVTERHLRDHVGIHATWSRRPSTSTRLKPAKTLLERLFGHWWKEVLRER